MSEQQVRIGFIGAGANTRLRHIPGFQVIPGVVCQVVCNRSEASSRAIANEFGIKRIVRHWQEVIDADDVDAVCIGTWPYLHAEISIAALNAGKHVLTEARMAMNAAEAEAMLAVSKKYPDRVAQIVPAPMSLEMDAMVTHYINEGLIGDLREVCVTHTHSAYVNSQLPLSWRQDIALSGSNILTVGIYYEIVHRWLTINPQRIMAQGKVFTVKRRNANGEWIEVMIPDSISILGDYENGIRFIGHFSGVETGIPRDEIRLNGSKGCLRADFKTKTLFCAALDKPESIVQLSLTLSKPGGWQVEADFIDSIRNGTPVRLTSFVEGVNYMNVTQAIRDSYDSGGVWITL